MGNMIRGVIDNELKGDRGIYLNTGVQTRLFKIGKTEAHLIPTFDIACVYASEDSLPPELALGVGGELIFIDDRLKSFPIRLGFAYDLRKNKNVARRVEIDFNMQFSF
jgi:hemolysin activation/secretion protein